MQSLNTVPVDYLSSLITLEHGDEEFKYLEAELSKIELNSGISQPVVAENFGEVWQYLYSEESHLTVFGKKAFNHVLRHRNHPKTHKLEFLQIPASESFCEQRANS